MNSNILQSISLADVLAGKTFHLNILESANHKILIGCGCVEHDAASELVAADLLPEPSLETGLSGKFTCGTTRESSSDHRPSSA